MDWTTIALGLIFAIANPWAVFELLRAASARKERLKRAREELADFLELTLVRDQELSRNVIYEMATALAQKRNVRLEEVYRPIISLHEVLGRLRMNPALVAVVRIRCEECVERLMIELKSTEGREFLNHIETAVLAAEAISSRSKAKSLLTQLIEQWGTFDDRAIIARFKEPADNMSPKANRETALAGVRQLQDKWANARVGPEPRALSGSDKALTPRE